MAIIEFINFKEGNLKKALAYIQRKDKTKENLIYGKDCSNDTAFFEFNITKKMFGKTDGRQYYHFTQSFNPKEKISYELANKVGVELAEYFKGYQMVVTTHIDKVHIHNHFIFNSVNFETGKKYHQSKENLSQIKEYSDSICQKYDLEVLNNQNKKEHIGRNEYRANLNGTSYKSQLIKDINICMKESNNKAEYITKMQKLGYKVSWQDTHKYITYTTPCGHKFRDKRLHNKKYLKEEMETYFKNKKQVKSYTLKRYKSTSRTLQELIYKSSNKQSDEINEHIVTDYGTNAKKEYARKEHYSTEELEM
ncbi:MAG: relaxase/mobilization nuclease domain-containing protein [Clostridia bacterium]